MNQTAVVVMLKRGRCAVYQAGRRIATFSQDEMAEANTLVIDLNGGRS